MIYTFILLSSCFISNLVCDTLTFNARYHNKKLSLLLYDLNKHFKNNALILGLETRETSFDFNDCDLITCLKNIDYKGKFIAMQANSFIGFLPGETYRLELRQKITDLEKKLKQKEKTLIDLKVLDARLEVVLGNLLKKLKLPVAISQEVKGTITAYLNNADILEVLGWLLIYFNLEIVSDHNALILKQNYFTP